MSTKKDRAIEIMQDCVDSGYEFMVTETKIEPTRENKEPITIVNVSRGKEEIVDVLNKFTSLADNDGVIKYPEACITVLSVAGAYKTNDLFVIYDAIYNNREYVKEEIL
jgi:hypothetical protein